MEQKKTNQFNATTPINQFTNQFNNEDLKMQTELNLTKIITNNSFCRTVCLLIIFSFLMMNNYKSFSQCGMNATITQPSSGSLHVDVTGGTPPYTYQWSDFSGSISGATSQNITGLTPCQYKVIVQDASSCIKIATYAIMPTIMVGTLTGNVNGVVINATVSGLLNPTTGLGQINFQPIPASIGYSLLPNLCLGASNGFACGIEHGTALNGAHLFKGKGQTTALSQNLITGDALTAIWTMDYNCGNTIVLTGTINGTAETLTNCSATIPFWQDTLIGNGVSGDSVHWSPLVRNVQINPFGGGASYSRPWWKRKHDWCHCPISSIAIGGTPVSANDFFPPLVSEKRTGSSGLGTYDVATSTLHFEVVNNIYPTSAIVPSLPQWALILMGGLLLFLGLFYVSKHH